MTTPNASSPLPEDDGFPDDLVTILYVEGRADTRVKPSHPAVRAMLEADREVVAMWNAYAKKEQERLNARGRTARDNDGGNQVEKD